MRESWARFGSELGSGNRVQGAGRVQESRRAAGFGSECTRLIGRGSGPGAEMGPGAQVQDPGREWCQRAGFGAEWGAGPWGSGPSVGLLARARGCRLSAERRARSLREGQLQVPEQRPGREARAADAWGSRFHPGRGAWALTALGAVPGWRRYWSGETCGRAQGAAHFPVAHDPGGMQCTCVGCSDGHQPGVHTQGFWCVLT